MTKYIEKSLSNSLNLQTQKHQLTCDSGQQGLNKNKNTFSLLKFPANTQPPHNVVSTLQCLLSLQLCKLCDIAKQTCVFCDRVREVAVVVLVVTSL